KDVETAAAAVELACERWRFEQRAELVEGDVHAFEIGAVALGSGEIAKNGAAEIDDGDARRRCRQDAREVGAVDDVRVSRDDDLAAARDELRQEELLRERARLPGRGG